IPDPIGHRAGLSAADGASPATRRSGRPTRRSEPGRRRVLDPATVRLFVAAGHRGPGRGRGRVPEQGQDEVADLARQFNAAAARVETLVKSHKSLLANASHELRSPLTRIRM